MQRRTFFKTTLALLAGTQLPLAAASAPTPKYLFIQRTFIAGFQYYDGPHLEVSDPPNLRLTLEREPDNPHDRRAVALYWHHHKLGYIPRRHNHTIAQMLDHGAELQAKVIGQPTEYSPWEGWEIEVEAVV